MQNTSSNFSFNLAILLHGKFWDENAYFSVKIDGGYRRILKFLSSRKVFHQVLENLQN